MRYPAVLVVECQHPDDTPHRTDRQHPATPALIDGMQAAAEGRVSPEQLEALYDDAVRDTLRRFEATGSPVVTDGEQRKPSFATYPVAGLTDLAAGGVTIPFEDGHTRQLPVLTTGPFRYATYAWSVPRRRAGHDGRPAEAGGHLRLGDQPHVPGRRHRRLPARGLHRGPRTRGGVRDPRLPRPRRASSRSTSPRRDCRSSSTRRAACSTRSSTSTTACSSGLSDEERSPGRRALLSGRRPGLDAQRRRRLRASSCRPCSG